jgi:hypothetical protein
VSGSALPKQVPALVERTFQPPQLVLLLLGSQLPVLDPSSQLMLLVDQRSDLLENLLFVHDVILAHYVGCVNLDPTTPGPLPRDDRDHDPRSRAIGRPLAWCAVIVKPALRNITTAPVNSSAPGRRSPAVSTG